MTDGSNIYDFATPDMGPAQQDPNIEVAPLQPTVEVLSDEASAQIIEWAAKGVKSLRDEAEQAQYGVAA